MNKVQVLVDDDLYKLMVDFGKVTGLSLSAVTRLALIKYLKQSTEEVDRLDKALMGIKE